MRIHALKLFLLFPCFIQAQNDSSSYFIKQLNKKNLPDSVVAHYGIRLSSFYSEKDFRQALTWSRKAFYAAKSAGSDRLLAESANNLAKSLCDLGSYDSSLFYAMQSHSAAQKTEDLHLIFDVLNLKGNIYLKKSDLPNAKKQYDEALQISLVHPSIPSIARIYQNLGNYYFKAFNFKKSIGILREGEAIAAKSNDKPGLMGIYGNLGQLYAFMHKMDSAQHYLLPALDYFQKQGKTRNQALINQNLGMVYGQLKNITKMEEYLDKSYKQFLSIGDEQGASGSFLQKVNSYFQSYQFDKCLKTLNYIEPVALKNNHENTLAVSYVYKAAIFSMMQDSASAVKYQQMAEVINRQVNNPAINQMNMLIKGVITSSRLKSGQGDSSIQKALLAAKKWIPASIIQTSLESVSQNKEIASANKEELSEVYRNLLSTDSTKSKQHYDSLINRSVDSSFSALYNKQLMELETKYKTKQKDDSISTQKQLIAIKNKSISTRNYFLAGLAVLALLILVLFMRSRSQAQKINRQYSEIRQLQSELTHRTGNFFNSIKGMLAVASATTTDKETVASLNSRVGTINRLYHTLYSSPGKSELPFTEMLTSICNDFELSFGKDKQIKIHCQSNACISKQESVPLAFIITELLTNAEKYAFAAKNAGEIHVHLSENKDKRVLHVWDNGSGIENNIPRAGSQGMSIIKSYSKNLEGAIHTWNDNGYHFKMEF